MIENELSKKIIGAAIEVHKNLGPGLLESVYEEALCHELHLMKIAFSRQKYVPIKYKGVRLASDLKLDLLIADKLIVEVKAKEKLSKIDKPQLLSYLKLSNKKLGLLINFHTRVLREGIYRIVNNLPE
jgi:GxxExxY protein